MITSPAPYPVPVLKLSGIGVGTTELTAPPPTPNIAKVKPVPPAGATSPGAKLYRSGVPEVEVVLED